MKKAIIITLIIALSFYILAKMLSPGSYLNAEEFKFKTKEKTLINAIKIFKQNNPRYIVPSKYLISDGKKDSNDYWYRVHIYFPEDSCIASGWIRQAGFKPTIFALVSVKFNNLGWKRVNEDLSAAENKKQIARFEKEVIEPLHEIVGDK